ncbi:MAG: hypothetical protein AAFX03_01905 [Pseudomonadota bacterium]
MLKTTLAALFMVAAAPSALALTQAEIRECNAMAAAFKQQRQEVEMAKAARDAAAMVAEQAGAAWEEAETHRLVSAGHAETADEAEAAFETAKTAHARAEARLADLAGAYQANAAVYNAKCVRE